ncbi:hypothetical protein A2276_06370 [candidate division WOR-1 bacterium RIFOXYA12_FULL_43_27]|uniref:Uncharacterized protein n=1 Tax=candidate division WOR-1 bacterium RIFOXYC2_FULL_46_14 TaxID=1802587 RepID=A0A1F4U747_UNCSA|nr:MAG: hypothetical protein A2276_06370 [candidate division WOR-1 bacterium RIFOXYA12_FULL_43_27]OGC20276.1 MAG: hypothetical protein A2292_04370 [candidate division WOR-1 bacterium RIFOXYB2_FULL_46_45]OGC31987.1 MAG: hypothetical protein A2232_07080 [candidate division WOR-1 bacterium RIFOXYA2_FULL_46_56]OGC40123.1 MAG: hypothetical protein A2438_02390 [candidate division WOR-1 bacterium RIFOXYC2_FULL_46_14]
MSKNVKELKEVKELVSYFRKLPPIRQIEALDYVKWLWVSPQEEYTEEEWKKIDKLAKQKGKTLTCWEDADNHLKSMMK